MFAKIRPCEPSRVTIGSSESVGVLAIQDVPAAALAKAPHPRHRQIVLKVEIKTVDDSNRAVSQGSHSGAFWSLNHGALAAFSWKDQSRI